MSETNFSKNIRKLVLKRGGYIFKVSADAFQEKALDLYCCYKGRYIALEAKYGKNTADKVQLKIIKEIREAGGIAEVAGEIEIVKEILDCIDEGRTWNHLTY